MKSFILHAHHAHHAHDRPLPKKREREPFSEGLLGVVGVVGARQPTLPRRPRKPPLHSLAADGLPRPGSAPRRVLIDNNLPNMAHSLDTPPARAPARAPPSSIDRRVRCRIAAASMPPPCLRRKCLRDVELAALPFSLLTHRASVNSLSLQAASRYERDRSSRRSAADRPQLASAASRRWTRHESVE